MKPFSIALSFAALLTAFAAPLSQTFTAPTEGAVISQHTEIQDNFAKASYKEIQKLRKDAGGDLTKPREIVCAWQGGTALKNARIEVAETADFKTGKLTFPVADGASSAAIHSLKTGTRYCLRLAVGNEYSAVRTFDTKVEAPRWIKVEGIANVRDCGGWVTKSGERVRQGLFYRGSEMNNHVTITPAGTGFLEEQIALRSLIDIRSNGEIKKANGRGSMLSSKVQWIHIPLPNYENIFKGKTPQNYAKIFRLLLDKKNLPAYLHCYGGADRTGTIIFMFKAVLGVKDEDLLLDYELTTLSRFGQRTRDSKQFKPFLAKLDELAPGRDFETKARIYFKQAGITDAEIDALKAIFLEKTSR